MDKIAIISDIHGNIPALEAVLEDINKRNIQRIICLGDIIGKGPFPEKAVDIIREKCESVVKGNWDTFITEGKAFSIEVGSWNINKLGYERVNYLKELPIYIELIISGRLVRLCHAAIDSVYYRVHANAPTEEKIKLFKIPTDCECLEKKESDIVGYGDIHSAYIQNFQGKTIFNSGSVGNPLDMTLASYAIIEGEYGSKELNSVSINIVKVPYDIEKAVLEAQNENMPELEEYINELRTGRYRGLGK
jgi:protein phosphatase